MTRDELAQEIRRRAPLHADELIEHLDAYVQAERERIAQAMPEAVAARVTWGDGVEFISVADAARIVRGEPDDE